MNRQIAAAQAELLRGERELASLERGEAANANEDFWVAEDAGKAQVRGSNRSRTRTCSVALTFCDRNGHSTWRPCLYCGSA